MSNDLIAYLKTQNDNVYSLNVGEASSHMLAMHKFMEGYLRDFSQNLDDESDKNSIYYESKKILDFLSVMTNILASSKLENYFHDTLLVSKSKLHEFRSELCNAENSFKEELNHAILKISVINHKISDKLNEL